MIIAFVSGAALALAAVAWVLHPLFRDAPRARHARAGGRGPADAESMIAQWRVARGTCPTCGPRPEAGAICCSACGRYLPGRCPHCGHDVAAEGASHCGDCGEELAAT